MKCTLVLILLWFFVAVEPKIACQSRAIKATKQTLNRKFLNSIEGGDVIHFYRYLRRGANVNTRGFVRTTALMTAALNGRTTFLAILIARGARVNSKNQFGNTALIDAASFGEVEMVRWLLAAGANGHAKNESDRTAMDFALKSAYAKQDNYQEVIRLLKNSGAMER
ncbi:MAG: ankyrin repeat domain-containing protein [Pyrinomonadaceae bacterium]